MRRARDPHGRAISEGVCLLLAAAAVTLSAGPVQAAPAGRLLQPGLVVERTERGNLNLLWAGSCLATDVDFVIYAGSLGDFHDHTSIDCTTSGATMYTFTPQPGNRYYLVVPRNATHEGSYGTDGDGFERPPSPEACLDQEPSDCPTSVLLTDIDSGQTSPAGNYRWMDVADQVYSVGYRESYDYTQASVELQFFPDASTFRGVIRAENLKPHFAYQVKIVGIPGTAANEAIGFTGRWWQEEWNGSEWAGGWNLNSKGNGSSPSPNDVTYLSRRDIPDETSPTGLRYRYSAYLVFGYFITDEAGDALLSFEANNSYHVLWKTSQRSPSGGDGPVEATTFQVQLPDPVGAYSVGFPEATVGVFGEWERLPPGSVMLPPGAYDADFIFTEESFHGGGLAGGWAAAVGAPVLFEIIPDPAP